MSSRSCSFFLEAAYHVGKVVGGLGVLSLAALFGRGLELGQLGLAQLLALELTGEDVHGQLFVVLLILLVHLVHHGDVLHQRDFMLFQLGGYLVDVVLGLVVLRLERGYALALFLEKAEETLLFVFLEVEALQLNNQIAQLVAYFAHVLGAYLAQRSAGEVGDVLLRGGAVVEYLLAVRHIYLSCKLAHGSLLTGGEAVKLQLFRRDLLLLCGGYGLGLGLFKAQIRRGLGRCGVGVEGEGGDELLVFVHFVQFLSQVNSPVSESGRLLRP